VRAAVEHDAGLQLGVNVAGGHITNTAVADSLGVEAVSPDAELGLAAPMH
jgi:alanine dehydrogenase